MIHRLFLLSLFVAVMSASWTATLRADEAADEEQAAFTAAVDRVAPSVARIETTGGLERVGRVLTGGGPTTGLVVDPTGYIISSAFNFVHKPASILVTLPGLERKPARLVATDHSRMLVLLKIDVEKPLPTCSFVPVDAMRVGQWAVAVGRTFDVEQPNLAVGILSALGRVWGKAIQTDAAVSPNNYGGPLVDVRGRVLGVLVPLSPDSENELAGMEWYDSGIGFAVPLEHIMEVLPRLEQGEDLWPGWMGVQLKGSAMYSQPPIVAQCEPKSPAATAGIQAGDRIVAIDGRPTDRMVDFREQIGHRYAGDTIRVTLERGDDRIEREIKLTTAP